MKQSSLDFEVNSLVDSVKSALTGHGVTPLTFAQTLISLATVLILTNEHPTFGLIHTILTSYVGLFLLANILFWIAPLKELAYVVDRVAAIRQNLQYMAPYTLELLPTLPEMLPFLPKIIDNIEQVGPFIPICLQPSCKKYTLPLMPRLMPDLEILLPEADVLGDALPKMAPHMEAILPYTKQLIPFTRQLLPILDVEEWYKVNKYLDVIVPHIAKVAPHSKVLAKQLPLMLPYMDILSRHIDNLVAEIDETMECIDEVVPLLPLLPAAEQLGILDQPFAFKALPKIVSLNMLPRGVTEAAAGKAADLHSNLLRRLSPKAASAASSAKPF